MKPSHTYDMTVGNARCRRNFLHTKCRVRSIALAMADVIPIRSTVLHEQVARKLRAMLVEGRIAAGTKLNERELSERLQVSRTPLREAIRQLAAEGLVALLPHRGAVAIELDENEVAHSFELMAALEGLSGELAAQRIEERELQAIRAPHSEIG